ncbi:CDP-glycerol glycerophosphotransferase family protein [Peribacillus kribbensis]|uniref:CDP-glycerol glycerophosphotransferase family protein n=1 Tax=Peribacillus kribbensis TaxID=356658 RepID=UPI000478E83F|nr:CDP-glycerol glycerophosphotransferase family protein [Peribacillus kribbensis]
MAREAAISLYLLVFRILFLIFRCFPLQKKAVFVSSFGDNCLYVLHEMKAQKIPYKTVFLNTKNSRADLKDDGNTIVFNYGSKNIAHFFASIYHLATSSIIIVDNYFAFLSAASFRPQVKRVQVWHAAGAIKQFGLKDPSIKDRSRRARDRFKQVYKEFQYIPVGSEIMADIFKESFGSPDSSLIRTGVPRTDFFYNEIEKTAVIQNLYREYPEFQGKRVILYAPTYRDSDLTSRKLALDVRQMHEALADQGCVLLLKLHPAVIAAELDEQSYPGFLYNLSGHRDINELLLITDLLISDYSSIPFEYSILGKPMIFYSYDLEDYTKERGFWEDYQTSMPGPIVSSTAEIIEVINQNSWDLAKIIEYKEKWNTYSRGNSSRNLVEFLFKDRD